MSYGGVGGARAVEHLRLVALTTLLDQVVAWSTALAPLRQPATATAAA